MRTGNTSGVLLAIYSQVSTVAGFICGLNINGASGGRIGALSGRNTGFGLGTDYNLVAGGTAINDSQWHHVAARWNGAFLQVFVDGKPDGSVAWGFAPGYASVSYGRIGILQNTAAGFAAPLGGQASDISIYNRALSPNEIRLLASRRGIAYEMAPRSWSAEQIAAYRARYYSQVIGSGVI